MLKFIIFSVLFVATQSQTTQPFSYTGATGPANWGQFSPICTSGQNQSPINIVSASAATGGSSPILISQWYDQPSSMTFSNDGTKISIKFLWASNLVPELYVLGNTVTLYQFVEMQFHGSQTNNSGSEHTIDGTSYDMEVQLVFSKVNLTQTQALNTPGGYAIVSKFFTANTNIQAATVQADTWSILLQFVTQPGSTFTTSFPWVNSFGDIFGNIFFTYYTYNGSFTQPGCQEVVTWIVGATPVQVAFPEVGKFRFPLNTAGSPIAPNDRPQQALNGRQITKVNVPYFP